MKTLLTLIAVLFVGCGESETSRLEAEAKAKISKEDLLKKSVVGTYETKEGEDTFRLIILENGKFENLLSVKVLGSPSQKTVAKGTWKFEAKEVHVLEDGREFASVFKIESNGDLKQIANKSSSSRKGIPKENQITFKKIK